MPTDGKTIKVTDPATGETIGTVPSVGVAETRRAIEAAERALPAWRAKTAKERAAILRKWFELVMANADDLAFLMTREQGKPLAEAKGEVVYGASFLEWFAEEAKRVYGDVIPQTVASRRILVLKQPVGVCAAITPWNFPNAMITRKVGPALAAGCTMVVKPASATPVLGPGHGRARRAGRRAEGRVQRDHRQLPGRSAPSCAPTRLVRKVSFTGSTEVGKILLKQCADTVKRVSMELGGLAPFIVFDDADLDQAVEGAIACKFRNCGQTCVCTNRIYVQAGVYDAFAEKFAAAAAKLQGRPRHRQGRVHRPDDRRQRRSRRSRSMSATPPPRVPTVLLGGKRHQLGGQFFEPTVLANCNEQHEGRPRGDLRARWHRCSASRPRTDVIRQANDADVGLAGYFYARDIGRIFRVAEALEVGLVGVNDGVISVEVAPFGGVKESGMGREGSKYGIEEYLEIKYVSLGGIG